MHVWPINSVTLTQLCCAQRIILRVRTVAYCCEDAMGIQMSVALQSTRRIPHAISVLEEKELGICFGLCGALDVMKRVRPGIWANIVRWGAWSSRWKWTVRCHEGSCSYGSLDPVQNHIITSGFVKIRLVVSKLLPDKSHLKWWCTPTNWPWGCLHYSWITACSTCLHGSNCYMINLLIAHLIHFLNHFKTSHWCQFLKCLVGLI